MIKHTPIALLIAALGSASAHAADPATLGTVDVIGTAPLPGLDVPRDHVPSAIRTLDDSALRKAGGSSLAENLQRRLPGVSVNEVTGNPLQADLNYRGFTASPLLGTPQGLSVFMDGVRLNETFGDVVSWDLIPQSAIADLTLAPGANPLYGLNTQGGAIGLHTKRGDTHPGGEASLSSGAFGRTRASLSHGGSKDELSWFVAGDALRDDGWRERSPSEAGQFFGKLAWTTATTDIALTLAQANTDLIGNGLTPTSLLADDRNTVFTHPDQTRNRSTLLALSASHWLNDSDRLAANAYLRRTRSRTLNGDANDDYEDAYDTWVTGGMIGPAPDETGVLNRTATDQNGAGLGLQWTHYAERHQFALGVSHDRGHARFSQTAQEGELTDKRGVDTDEASELENKLSGRTLTTSVYVTDTIALAPTVQLTAAARFNHTHVINRDKLNRTAPNLDGDFTYNKLNPALGLTWQASPALTMYGGVSQSNRAPSPIELGCADPDNPCTLPNALAADPFLKQVVTRSLELGLRGQSGEGLRWHAGLFRATNHDDILFVGTSTSAGYFTNFGQTRRQGLELGASGNAGAVDWRVDYTLLDASFRSSACLLAENNSSRGQSAECTADGQDDEILVSRGDRLPGLPRHSLKLGVDWRATERLTVGASVLAYSGQTARGNENNQHRAGTATDRFGETREFDDDGKLPGYAILNLSADYALGSGWTLFGRIDNVFDQRYATAAALAENPFVGGSFQADPDDWRRERFEAPGTPRAGWIGVRYAWGGR